MKTGPRTIGAATRRAAISLEGSLAALLHPGQSRIVMWVPRGGGTRPPGRECSRGNRMRLVVERLAPSIRTLRGLEWNCVPAGARGATRNASPRLDDLGQPVIGGADTGETSSAGSLSSAWATVASRRSSPYGLGRKAVTLPDAASAGMSGR